MSEARVVDEATNLRITEDSWLSRMLERSVFRIDIPDVQALTRDECALIAAHADRPGPAMYFAKVDTAEVAAVRDLGRAGMAVVDVSVALDCGPASPAPAFDGPTIEVDDCGPQDAEAVLDIAGSCFRYTRFHVDPDIPRHLAHRVKREWIANYVRGQRGERLFVARLEGRPAGFLAMMSVDENGRRIPVIDLIGVRSDLQRCGIGRRLVSAFLDATASCQTRRVITQAANIPSLGLYQTAGFQVTRMGYVLHMHR